MIDWLHKLYYTGVGFAALSEEKAREIVAELQQKGEVSKEEGKQLAQELIDKTKKHSEEFRQAVRDEVSKCVSACKGVSQAEVEALKARIAELEKRAGVNCGDNCTCDQPTEDSL